MALNIEFNGQSKRVRVTPGTTMFQVLEDARAQFQLSDARQYQLLHRKRPVDLAIPFRLTGVSNNALLEIQALASSSTSGNGVPQQVRVCVQLADGKRVQSAFASDATLASILTAFTLLPAQHEFALSFLQHEISADAFATTTLKELGIVSGSAIFRVQAAAAARGAAPVTQAQAPPAPIAPSSSDSTVRATPVPTPVPAPTAVAPRYEPAPAPAQAPRLATPREDVDVEMKGPAPPLSSYDALQRLRDSCFDAAATGAITTLLKIVTNVLSHPENEKMRSIRVANAAFQRSVAKIDGGVAFLESIGFALDPETQCLVLRSATDAAPMLHEGLRLLHVEADDLRIDPATRPQVVAPTTSDPAFDVYKSQIHRMQAQPRGPSVTEVLVDTLKSKQAQLLGHDIPPRNTVVTLPGRTVSARTASAFDGDDDVAMADEHPSDSRIVISTLKAKRAELEKAQNFRTQAMRELEELKKKKVFQTTLLRVQFPDRVVLQATFHPNETIRAVMDHVASCLRDAAVAHAFHLYVTPPMQKLQPEKTLAELNLVPAALTYLSWTNASTPALYLRDDLVADEFAESKSSDDVPATVAYPKPIALEPQPATARDAAVSSASDRSAAPKSATKAAGKKPAWLKLSR